LISFNSALTGFKTTLEASNNLVVETLDLVDDLSNVAVEFNDSIALQLVEFCCVISYSGCVIGTSGRNHSCKITLKCIKISAMEVFNCACE
jgi:hypothetical protein